MDLDPTALEHATMSWRRAASASGGALSQRRRWRSRSCARGRRVIPDPQWRAEARRGVGLRRGARERSLELVGVAGGVGRLQSWFLPRFGVALARTRGIRRCARSRRTNSHKGGGKGRSGFTSIGRRSQAAVQVVAVVNGNGDLGHEQAKERCQQVHKIILSIIV